MSGERRPPGNYIIPSDKITEYLLNLEHPQGASKARFFLGLGFHSDDPNAFADAMFAHVLDAETITTYATIGGVARMVCDGPLPTPREQRTRIRSIWVLIDSDLAQLVSAYPARGRS